jgi:ATP-dependent Zn protease
LAGVCIFVIVVVIVFLLKRQNANAQRKKKDFLENDTTAENTHESIREPPVMYAQFSGIAETTSEYANSPPVERTYVNVPPEVRN